MSELNLIPYELRQKHRNSFKKINSPALIISIIVVLILAIGLPLLNIQRLGIEQRKLNEEIKRGEEVLKESEKLKSDIVNFKKHIALVDSIKELKSTSVNKVRGLEKYIVNDVIFESLIYGEDKIIVEARSANYDSICIFVANIQETSEYKNAAISQINYDKTRACYKCLISINY